MPKKFTDHKKLMGVLKQMVKRDRWRKIPKVNGNVLEKSITKSGNIKLVIKAKMSILFMF